MRQKEIKSDGGRFFRRKRNIYLLAGGAAALLTLFFALACLYLSGAFQPPPQVTVHAENVYAQTLRVVTDRDYEPFSYVDASGAYVGLDVELINEIANRLQMNLELELLGWPDANRRFFDGQADAILNMETDLVAEDSRMIATIPTTEKQYVVYGRESVASVAELYGKRVVSLHQVPELGLEREITYLNSYAEIFRALENGEYDFAICPIQVGNVFAQKLNAKDLHPSYAVDHVYGAIALAPRNAALRDRINAVISDMQKEGRLNALDSKWIRNRYQNLSLSGIIRAHPALGAAFPLFFLLILALFAALMFQRRNALEKDAYTERLRENLDTINRQSAELVEAKNRAEASNRAKSFFLSNMSHDMRTPMNAIIGYANLAKREGVDEEQMREYLDKIGASSQRLLALINDVLEMSRIESGKMDLLPAPMDLKETLLEIRDMFAAQMEEKGITFSLDVSQVRDSRVLCDKNRLDRVLLNFLSNAFKFTPEGGVVSVSFWQIDSVAGWGKYELRVRDSGIGMSKEFAERVFDAFERERTSTVSGIQGTGLGMTIAKSIIDLMGGTVEVITAPNAGTEFIVRVAFELAGDADSGGGTVREPEKTAPDVDFSRIRLLLVEDNEINREIAMTVLTEAGFSLDVATDGREAVEKVAASQPGDFGAVLMDVQMPVMDGYEATRAIRALPNPALANVPIIAMTANAFQEDVQTAKSAGMNAHIAKPLDVSKMMEVLTEVLSANPPRTPPDANGD